VPDDTRHAVASAPTPPVTRHAANTGDQAGFTLIGLMVLIAVINIGLGVAVTSWVTIGKRAKEAELIWRGQQYMRALQCHRQQTGGLPDELDELLDSDCIRALYPDPMNPRGSWRLIRQSELQREFGAGGSGGMEALDTLGRQLGAAGINIGETARGGFGAGGVGRPEAGGAAAGAGRADSLQAAYERLRSLSQRLDQNFSRGSGNGIVGVVSTSTDESLRLYQGEITYDAWRFVVQ